ncbi:MAG: 50S ribosomal protein L15 [candidate division WS1 bacterium]|jgi:large subunit ribosomal protein L15|nr:50S ribosomal protein L15 [candidate division WS1 bacterium]
MDLTDLRPKRTNKAGRKRVGRGHGSGWGKTSGRGQKGQKARYSIPPGLEGGQTPLHKRLPKLRGQSNKAHNIGIFRKRHSTINLDDLQRFEAGTAVTPELVVEVGMVNKLEAKGLKVLGNGELQHALTVRAHAFSESARAKIEAAGGSVEVIDT